MDSTDINGNPGISSTHDNLPVCVKTGPEPGHARQLCSEEQEQAQDDDSEEMSDDEPDTIDRLAPRPMREVRKWLYSSANRKQQRARFTAFAHSLWPSNDEFSKYILTDPSPVAPNYLL
jgi:hypothetical protein